MAKQVTEAKHQTQELVEQLDPELMREIEGDLGKGVSTDAADNLVPLIYVLHPNSPQCLDGPMQIEGARGGDIWLKNFSENPIIPGKEGIWFMPCVMYQKWTEWIPRTAGGGFVASYDYNSGKLPEGAVRDENERKRPRFFFPDTGHDCVDTRYEAGIVWRDATPFPYVIPFKSTGHKVSRAWMTKRMSLIRRQGNSSGIWPAWSHIYQLKTSLQHNTQGQWYLFDVGSPTFYMPGIQDKPFKQGLEIVGGDPKRAYQMGKALSEAFKTGAKQEMEDVDVGDERTHYDENGSAAKQRTDDNIPY